MVDLITNSSSELFVSATSSTEKAVKELVENLLLAGGCRFKADDLFDISLGDNPGYGEDDQAYYEESFGVRKMSVTVKPKIDSVAAKKAASVLETLVDTYSIQERYNG